MPRNKSLIGLARLLLLVALLTPLTVFVAVIATRTGLIDLAIGFGVLGLKVAPVLAWIGAGAGIVSLLLLIKSRSLWIYAVATVLVAAVSLGAVQFQLSRFGPAPRDVSTNAEDPPAFGRSLLSERRAAGVRNGTAVTCEGLVAVDSQLAPDVAAWALKQSGVTVMGRSPFRVDGWQEGMWFGIQHDVTVRIRPGRTDIRVAARDGLPIGPRACDLAKRIVAEMNALR